MASNRTKANDDIQNESDVDDGMTMMISNTIMQATSIRRITARTMMNTPTTTATLPILDINDYYTNQTKFVEEIRYVCHTIGFFFIKHNYPCSINRNMIHETNQFFQLPIEEKMKISYEYSSSFRGYMKMGVENTLGQLDYREQIEYAVEYPNSTDGIIHTLSSLDDGNGNGNGKTIPIYERLKSPKNPWPDTIQPTLRPTTLEFASHVCHVADCIRDSLCMALGLPSQHLKEQLFDHPTEVPHWVIKLIS